jgi:predicted  nucleic acid-binding Zn-ribbon protein
MIMCCRCGEFISAVEKNGSYDPIADECPDCGGQKFKDNETETVIRTDESE